MTAPLGLTHRSDAELRRLIADAQRELQALRQSERRGRPAPAPAQVSTVQELAVRPIQGMDLITLRSFFQLSSTELCWVSGLSFPTAWKGSTDKVLLRSPISSVSSALRMRVLLTMPVFRLPWHDRPLDDIRAFLAESEGLPVDLIDADYLAKMTGLDRRSPVRWIANPARYPLTGQSAKWLYFLCWYVEQYAPSERQAVLREIEQRVALEVLLRGQAAVTGGGDSPPPPKEPRSGRRKGTKTP